MNTGIYRLVFNRSRHLCMFAGELTRGTVKNPVHFLRGRVKKAGLIAIVKPLVFATWLTTGWVLTAPAAADIITDHSVVEHQQQQAIEIANGIRQANIRTPNSNSLSHNSHSEFNIDQGDVSFGAGPHRQIRSIDRQTIELKAGGDIGLETNADPTLSGVDTTAGSDIALYAGSNNISLSAEQGWLTLNDLEIPGADPRAIVYLSLDWGNVSDQSFKPNWDELTVGIIGLKGRMQKFSYDFTVKSALDAPKGFQDDDHKLQFSLNWQW